MNAAALIAARADESSREGHGYRQYQKRVSNGEARYLVLPLVQGTSNIIGVIDQIRCLQDHALGAGNANGIIRKYECRSVPAR